MKEKLKTFRIGEWSLAITILGLIFGPLIYVGGGLAIISLLNTKNGDKERTYATIAITLFSLSLVYTFFTLMG